MKDTAAYTFRKLEAPDLFTMMRILTKIGLEDVKKCFSFAELKEALKEREGESAQAVEAVGMKIVFDVVALLIGKLPECEKEIYTFLASLTGKKEKEINELPIADFYNMILDVFKQEDFRDFFGQVMASAKLAK